MAVTKGDGQVRSARGVRGAAARHAGEQGLLFDDELTARPEDVGYRGPTACTAAGITYRQLDYWARTGLVEPTVRAARGSGSQRLYGFRDILVLKVVKRLLDTGISLQQIRAAVVHLRAQGTSDLAQVTLMSDGVSVYACTQEVEGSLADLPAERAGGDIDGGIPVTAAAAAATAADELAHRRARKTG